MKQANSVEATAAPYTAIPVWEALPIQSGATGFSVGEEAQAIAPTSRVVERFEPPAYVRNVNQHFSGPCGLSVLPLEFRVQPSSLSPLFPLKSICTLDSSKKPGNLTTPGSSRQVPIAPAFESGLVDGRPPGLELPAVFPLDPVVHTKTGSWRAASRKPFAPDVASLGTISFVPRVARPARFPGRPDPVSEEVVPYRSWYSLTELSESPGGFVYAPPSTCTSSAAAMGDTAAFGTWKSRINRDFPGKSLLAQSDACWEHPEPSCAGARTVLPRVKPVTSVISFQPGLAAALHGDEPFLADESPFVKDVEKVPPPSQGAEVPRPGMAYSTGFTAWSDPLNSYVRRNPGNPRFRDNTRIVHALRLAPAGRF